MGTRETTLWPTERSVSVGIEEGVFLLETEPRYGVLCELHDLGSVVTIVCPVGSTVAVVGLCKDKDVFTATEGVLEDRSRTEVDIGVVARRLIGGGAIKVPDAELADVGHLFGDGLWGMSATRRCQKECTNGGLGAEAAITIDPDI